jgi:hypothetical protein
MNSVVVYRRGTAVADSSVGSGSGGGGVDDILRRLGNVETDISELRADVRAISATIPHLATAAAVSEMKADLRTEIATTKADLRAEIADVRTAVGNVETKLASMETAIIKWIIATVLTTAGLAFSIAKFVH